MNETTREKPTLSILQIWNMCFGFLGIQFGMGLQLANMSPIYRYLGADEHSLPLLWLAGPVTGLVVQPIIGAMGDNTWGKWGRRRPYFTVGAIVAGIALIAMPYSSFIWMAAGLMWVLDAAVNSSMESFRAMVGDILPKKQRPLGFSMQTFLVGAGGLVIGFLPFILGEFGVSTTADSNTVPDFVKYAFIVGAIVIVGSILWTGYTTKEYPPEDIEQFKKERAKSGFLDSFREILEAIKNMPLVMKQLWWVQLLVWFALPLMWQYLSLSIARHVYNAPLATDVGFSEGVAMGGIGSAIYGISPMIIAFLIPSIIKHVGTRKTYAFCLIIGAVGFLGMHFTSGISGVFALCFLMGIGNAGVSTVPYVMVSSSVPQEKMGVYMGLLNAFVCLPQIFMMLSLPLFYDSLLMGDPRNALVLAGACWVVAALLCLRITKSADF
ncbi:SLC45 family MFS transporter [Aggregatimonas sangjinii]|uniref:SLC45 family MFS transporter n=1 Tax=Aggregatimonas sangjinii TaxID=2583587 RepID=A0A5B7SUF6_9FLAO|nr:MFS transporter [Aggregatimonas sangjinii]QCX00678.1 SLC45 family MFS transporter [Aggregatimonas sangjinii]